MSGKKVIYFDACIWIAHLTEETRDDPLDMQGVAALVKDFDHGKIDIATSVISLVEVMDVTLTDEQKEAFSTFMKHANVHLVQVDRRISHLAAEIRGHYRGQGVNGETIKTPDAIHLASAIELGCSVFYTFDGSARRPKPFSLLTLTSPVAGKYQLAIQKPVPGQLSF